MPRAENKMQHAGILVLVMPWVFTALLLTGCETMSKEECLSADWYQVGYDDGRDGKERKQIEYITESCAKAGVIPDRELYFSGRDDGIREYCSPRHAFSLGVNGSYYHGVCPPETAAVFESYYREGKRIYTARQHLKDLETERHKLEQELEAARTDRDRKNIRDGLEALDERLRNARDRLRFIEYESRLIPAP